ncbi:MAG: BolA family protein [Thiotrichales bacterium]
MTPETIKEIIEAGLAGSQATVTGEESKFETTVISDEFKGLNTVRKHQLVYGLLNDHIASGAIHALTIKAYTPEEWSQLS